MCGIYTATFKISGLNAQKTMRYLTAPAAKVVEIIAATVTNQSNVTNQQFEVQIANITTMGTPTATAVTPTPHDARDHATRTTATDTDTRVHPTYCTATTHIVATPP